ncbi:hypothetical protein NQ317_000013 [Molorchus minor]|uniref:Amino acid transporter transmembrane domain-containing protein n=1 Tax=Molorchus minor TaxID=1323400 RepID=A0ABQ9JCF7_9CUCU|nr:hypothetical protein NQ317_000013 [Molorchus minor]
MNNVVRIAVNICTLVYISVGLFGYIAFSHKQFTGNILLTFSPSLLTDVIKIGFVLSVAFSFPLVIFPVEQVYTLYSIKRAILYMKAHLTISRKNLHTLDKLELNTVTIDSLKNLDKVDLNVVKAVEKNGASKGCNRKKAREEVKEVRHEPPQPIEPQEDIEKNIKDENVVKSVTLPNVGESKVRETKLSDINIEIEKKLSVNDTNVDRSNDEQQNEVQKEIVEQQKKLIEVIQSQQKNVETNEVHKVHEEKVKAMKQIESIALKAIEKISGGKDETLAADVEKRLEAKIEENVKKRKCKGDCSGC